MADMEPDFTGMTDSEMDAYQRAVTEEINRRLRIAAIPRQLRSVVIDARRGGELTDAKIRAVIEDAMDAPLT